MELIQKIIDFILGLLGVKKNPALPAPSSGASQSDYADAASSVRGLENVEGDVRVLGGKVIVQRDGAALIEDEDGERVWTDQVNKAIAREQWVDEWGPTGHGPSADRRRPGAGPGGSPGANTPGPIGAQGLVEGQGPRGGIIPLIPL